MSNNQYKVSLNLGGGAARGFAHIGALRLIQEERIPFDILVGISMGALVGSLYCLEPDHQFVSDRMFQWLNSKAVQDSVVASYSRSINSATKNILRKMKSFYTKTGMLGSILLSQGMVDHGSIASAFYPFIPPIKVETLRLPFACSAVSLRTGISRVFRQGSLRSAILASTALPMVFPPLEVDGELFCDGGVLDKLGIDASQKLKCHKIIVIDVSNENPPDDMVKNGLDVLFRTEEIASNYRRTKQLKRADVVVSPIKGNIHWADYSRGHELIDMGYEATRASLDEIRSAIGTRNPFKTMFTFFRKKWHPSESVLN